MRTLRKNLTLVLMILFELVCGVLLLLSPEGFTKSLIIFFGLLLLVIGAIHLIRYLRSKGTDEASPALLGSSIVSLTIGVVFALGSDFIMGLSMSTFLNSFNAYTRTLISS